MTFGFYWGLADDIICNLLGLDVFGDAADVTTFAYGLI